MFENQTNQGDGNQTKSPFTMPKVEDIFSQTDQTAPAATPPLKTIRPNPPMPPKVGPIAPQTNLNEAELFGGRSFLDNKFLIIGLIIIIATVIIGGGYGISLIFKNKANQAPTTENAPVVNQPVVNQPVTPVAPVAEPNPQPTLPAEDSDSDGLTDEEEMALGTDKLKADTDGDGLTDHTEAEVFKTDPLKADTDGDGYNDGREVINGYDPKVPGSARLQELPL